MKTTIIIKEETIKVNEKSMIHRQIEVNNKLVFDDTCSIGLFVKDKSPLKQFTDWINDRISREQFESTYNIIPQRHNFLKSIQIFWFKLFGKHFNL